MRAARWVFIVFLGGCTPASTEAPPPSSSKSSAEAGPKSAPARVVDFGESASAFGAVDDRVMGGVSQSRLERHPEGHAVFAGELSLESNGGFASVRARADGLDLAGYSQVVLRFRGDGKRYKLRFQDRARRDGITYQVTFDTKAGVWQELAFPLDDFRPVWRGRLVPGAGPLARGRLRSVGLLIADEQAGPFRLEVDWLGAL